jgi:hypothetical protein
MAKRTVILLILATGIISFIGGSTFSTVRSRITYYQNASLVGGTLQELARALENERLKTGVYPATLQGISVSSFVPGDYSPELASKVLYTRTDKGYLMIVHSPAFATCDQSGHIQFQ